MIYIYDIIVNFNDLYFDICEWNKDDIITHIKKIPIYKISTKELMEIDIGIKINNVNLLEQIKNQTEYYTKNGKDDLTYTCLLCNQKKILAVLLDENGIIIKISDLIFEEEEDILYTYKLFNHIKININKMKNINLETRQEKNQKKFIYNKINESSDEQLDYLIYEITGNDKVKFDKKVYLYNLIDNNLLLMNNFFHLLQNNK